MPQLHTAQAQGKSQAKVSNTVEIVGVIDSINGVLVTVNGLTIDLTRAQLKVTIKVGTSIKIAGVLAADGSITAREVSAPKTGIQPGESEIIGLVDSLTGTTLVIGGQTIDISNAEVKAGLVAGKNVKIEFSIDPVTGQLIAREVNIVPLTQTTLQKSTDTQDSFEIRGTLEKIGDGFVIVSGQTIATDTAEIKGTLVIGALIKIELHTGEDHLVAGQIENAHPEDEHNTVAVTTGDISSKNSGTSNSAVGSTDDKGGQNVQPGDDKGGQNVQPGDDKGGNSGGGNSGSGNPGGGNSGGGNSGGGGGHDDGGGHK